MINKTLQFLRQPYPDRDDWPSSLKGGFFGGLIVFFILFAFRPFGLQQLGSKAFFYCLIFGGITFLIAVLYELFFRYVLKIRKDQPTWTVGKWILAILGLMLAIAIGNYLFVIQISATQGGLSSFLMTILSTVIVGIFPTTLFAALNTIRNLKANQQIASGILIAPSPSLDQEIVQLPIHKSSQSFAVKASDIIYLEAQQNYVNVLYQTEDGLEKEMIRNTLSAVEKSLTKTHIRRSHRSFLVNTSKISSISGNAQGLTLTFEEAPGLEVPVSRKYIPDFRR